MDIDRKFKITENPTQVKVPDIDEGDEEALTIKGRIKTYHPKGYRNAQGS